jgi:hypothetical protein
MYPYNFNAMLEVNVPQFGKVSNKLPRLCKPMLEKEAV